MLKKVFLFLFLSFVFFIVLFPYLKIGFYCFTVFEVLYAFYPLFLLLLPLILYFSIKQKFLKFQFIVLSLMFPSVAVILGDIYFNFQGISKFTSDRLLPLPVILFVLALFLVFYFLNIKNINKWNSVFVIIFFILFLLHFLGVLEL